jgi:hypothetical protein
MTRPGDQPHDERDARLAELLSDAVSGIEPTNRLDAIRNETKVTSMSSRRPWLYAVGGAVATAAVITAIAAAGGTLPGQGDDPAPAGQSDHATKEPEPSNGASEPTPSEPTPSETTAPASNSVVPVYFVGDTPSGPRLYREFLRNTDDADPLMYAAGTSVAGSSDDPDYGTLWPSGSSVTEVTSDGADILTVSIAGAPHDLPSGMTQAEAQLALQQVIYSVQAANGQGRVGVQFLLDGDRSDQVLGQPTSEPLANAPILKTLSLVSLSSPSEGENVSGDTLEVEGVANSFEANVIVRLQRWEGNEVLAQQPFTADGWMGDKLFPFSGTIDVSDVPPGEYVLIAMTDDPSGGEEGSGAFSDSRRITVE